MTSIQMVMYNKVMIRATKLLFLTFIFSSISCKSYIGKNKYSIINNNIHKIIYESNDTLHFNKNINLNENILNLNKTLWDTAFFKRKNFTYSYGSGRVLGVDSSRVMHLINNTDITNFIIPNEKNKKFLKKKIYLPIILLNNKELKNKGFYQLSNIYFFDENKRFFIVKGEGFYLSGSSGYLLFFKKVNGEWEFDFKIPLWIS